MFVLNTLHIFGYGEVQIIGKYGDQEINKKVRTEDLVKVTSLVDLMYAKKPAGNEAPNDYHAINIFNEGFADYVPAGHYQSWRTLWADLNHDAIQQLVDEVFSF